METCYRHPNRETGVRCSNCERPICPDCMTSTPVGMRCPECARRGATRVRTMRSVSEEPSLTYILIGINLLAGLFHLLTNMLSLWILGTMIEPAIGRWRFGLIYFVSLLCGSFGALLLSPDELTVGASGAIFGLLSAAAVVAWNRGFNLMGRGLGVWIGLNLLITFTVPNISVGGHVGGLVGGALTALLLVELRDRIRVPEYVPTLLCVAIGTAAVAGSIAVA